MICLACGDCCLRMSPKGKDCPDLGEHGTIYFCKDYDNRPAECSNHVLPGRFCPIGVEKLGLETALSVSLRIDEVYEATQEIQQIMSNHKHIHEAECKGERA